MHQLKRQKPLRNSCKIPKIWVGTMFAKETVDYRDRKGRSIDETEEM